MPNNSKPYFFAIGILAIVGLVYAFDLHQLLSFEAIRQHHQQWQSMLQENPLQVWLLFILAYTLAVSLSLPGASLLTITGGLLFGPWLGGFSSVLAASIGASLIFILAKTSLSDYLSQKGGDRIQAMRQGFQNHAFQYLLSLRLIPVFPFWLVNLAPALFGMRLPSFALATFIGIIPGTLVFAAFGAGLAELLSGQEALSLHGVLSPTMIAAFTGLGLLSLLPIVWKKYHSEKKQTTNLGSET